MVAIDRAEAIRILSLEILKNLSKEDRESHVLNWWSMDEDNDEYFMLSKELRSIMKENEYPPEDVSNKIYDELTYIAICYRFKGVTNKFINKLMQEMNIGPYESVGEVERLETCPCCSYRTLETRGEYDICELCHWEDNGLINPKQYSSPNRMTLEEAQEKLKIDITLLNKWVKDDQ